MNRLDQSRPSLPSIACGLHHGSGYHTWMETRGRRRRFSKWSRNPKPSLEHSIAIDLAGNMSGMWGSLPGSSRCSFRYRQPCLALRSRDRLVEACHQMLACPHASSVCVMRKWKSEKMEDQIRYCRINIKAKKLRRRKSPGAAIELDTEKKEIIGGIRNRGPW